jgi:prenyltransferase beta subunit
MAWVTIVLFPQLLLGTWNPPSTDTVSHSELRRTAERAIPMIELSANGSADQRECFTCHHQAVPILALTLARQRGMRVDDDTLARQVQHTITHLQRGHENYEQGKGQGGQVATAGYALLALDAADWPPDETTTAVVHYLLKHQREQPHYHENSNRPPTSGSDFTATYLAIHGLRAYGSAEQQQDVEQRLSDIRTWVHDTRPADTEDSVFRLRCVAVLQEASEQLAAANADLLDRQQADGGWSQLPNMPSDAYATATAVDALLTAGELPPTDPRIVRALRYLLQTQQADGTWHVATRADGFQTYFESGFPYEEDQFISMAATSWAVSALSHALPTLNPPPSDTSDLVNDCDDRTQQQAFADCQP